MSPLTTWIAVDKVAARNTLVLAGDFNAPGWCRGPTAVAWLPRKVCSEKRHIAYLWYGHTPVGFFCVANDLVLRNTIFDHKDIPLATWTGPGDRNANQIDYLAMGRKHAKAMLNCRVHRGAELETDHYLLVSSCRLHLSQPRAKQHQVRSGHDSGLLHDAML